MRKDEVLEFFGGSVKQLADALEMTQSAINQWKAIIPKGRRPAVREAMQKRAEDLEKEAKKLRKAAKAGDV